MAKCVIIKCKMIAQPIEMPCSKTNCRYFADCLATYEEYLGAEKPQTNADRIRAMSDEELADNWMRDFIVCHHCAYRYECECDEYVTYEKCREGIVEWLKQPVGGE